MKHKEKISVFVADNHPMIVKGLQSTLSACDHIECVGEASLGTDVISGLKETKPDVMLLDISMPGLTGPQILRRLKHHAPNVKVIVFTVHDEPEYISEVLSLGARGYLLKETKADELIRAIESVAAGDIFFSSCVQQVLLRLDSPGEHGKKFRPVSDLALKEEEVLRCVAEGLSNAEIARKLYVGERTVESYRHNIMDKLSIHTIAGLTKYAIQHGLLEIESD